MNLAHLQASSLIDYKKFTVKHDCIYCIAVLCHMFRPKGSLILLISRLQKHKGMPVIKTASVSTVYNISQYKNIKGNILKCNANIYFSKLCVKKKFNNLPQHNKFNNQKVQKHTPTLFTFIFLYKV